MHSNPSVNILENDLPGEMFCYVFNGEILQDKSCKIPNVLKLSACMRDSNPSILNLISY